MNDEKKLMKNLSFTGERPLYGRSGFRAEDCVFRDGESPLKECRDVELSRCVFDWKYPLWYCSGVAAESCTLNVGARAAIWYSDGISFRDSSIDAPKAFRRCRGITLDRVSFTNADETLWGCDGVVLRSVTAENGSYFAMNSRNIEVDGLTLSGNYAFDGAENVVIRNSRLVTKDAFWNSRNVTVYDSFISGEYLGWNSEGLTLIDCPIESHQGLCYIDRLKLTGCTMTDTDLAFEYSDVEADNLRGKAVSIFNPRRGYITIDRIDELIVEPDRVDPLACVIDCPEIIKRSEKPEWLR